MTRIFFSLAVAALLVASSFPANAESPSGSDVRAQEIATWIKNLDSDDYQERETATRRLIQAGQSAIAPIAEAAISATPEVAWRAAEILQQIGITGDTQTMGEVIRVMQQLGKDGNPHFLKASGKLVARWRKHRHDLAAAEIRRLGGEIIEAPNGFLLADGGIMLGGPVLVDLDLPEARFEALRDLVMEEVADTPVDPDVEEDAKLKDADSVIETREAEPTDIEHLIIGELRARIERADAEEAKAEGDKKDSPEVVEEKPDGVRLIDIPPLPDAPADLAEPPVVEVEIVEDLIIDVEGDEGFGFIAPPVVGGGHLFIDPFGGIATGSETGMARTVRLGKGWRGGDEGLRHLRQLDGASTLEVNELNLSSNAFDHIAQMPQLQNLRINYSEFDREDIVRLRKAKPNMALYATGKALLGVSGNSHGRGFHVTNVVNGSGAYNAGIQLGDVIVSTDGMPLRDLADLTIVVSQMDVGDSMPVVVLRGEKEIDLQVTLGPR